MKRTLIWLAVGFAVGTFASMWFGPALVTWWGTPPAQNQTFSCESQIHWATTRLVAVQLTTGGVLGVFLGVFVNVWGRRRRTATAAQGSAQAPPPAPPLH